MAALASAPTASPKESSVAQAGGVYTPEGLRAIARDAERRYEALLIKHPPGTFHADRNDARRLRDQALACAAWMEARGAAALSSVGPFLARRYRRQERVRIKKGAVVFSTKPGTPEQGVVQTRDQEVTVHSFHEGYVNPEVRSLRPGASVDEVLQSVIQGQVHWAGSGGYWRWTSVEFVEPCSTPAPTAKP